MMVMETEYDSEIWKQVSKAQKSPAEVQTVVALEEPIEEIFRDPTEF